MRTDPKQPRAFVTPVVREIRPPSEPRPAGTQRELVLASLLRRR
jgi:hypothetical protein